MGLPGMILLLQINHELLTIFSSMVGGGALGGLISTFIHRKENKRIKTSEVIKSEASAKKEDASAAMEMMELLERTVAHMERMNEYNKANSVELMKLLSEKDEVNEKLKNDVKLLQLQRTEDNRRITGLEKAFDREFEWRKDGDYHYCMVRDCDNRKPPLGTLKREAS
jgi:predicted RNase H-like nuclease (RuvC/YqgF family)